MNKFNARRVTIDGITFDSVKEANRYCELKLLLRAGKISNLYVHEKFELIPAATHVEERYGKKGQRLKDKVVTDERAVCYIADFWYYDEENKEYVVEDVKGHRQGAAYEIFVIKRKLMRQKYGYRIVEI